MYKVFVNEMPLILTDNPAFSGQDSPKPKGQKQLLKLLDRLYHHRMECGVLYGAPEELLAEIKENIRVVQAAGGVVRNAKDKLLMIRRNRTWDLPKGKLEKCESIEECAVREVSEETGVEGLRLEEFQKTTYHVFRRAGEFRLKEVFWYQMYSDFDGPFSPQQNEGITDVRWMGRKKLEKISEKTYQNIQLLVKAHLTEAFGLTSS